MSKTRADLETKVWARFLRSVGGISSVVLAPDPKLDSACYVESVFMLRVVDSILVKLRSIQRWMHASEQQRLATQAAEIALHGPISVPAPDLERARTLLVFKPDEIGDFVCALPAVQALKKRYPHLEIDIVTQAAVAPLAERLGLFRRVAGVSISYRLLRFPVFNPAEVCEKLGRTDWDCAVYLRTYPNLFRSFLRIPARTRVHPLDPRLRSNSPFRYPISSYGSERAHILWQLLELVAPLLGRKLERGDRSFPPFNFRDEDRKAVEALVPNEPYLAVHPFCRYETRRYPLEFWRDLWRRLREKYKLPIVIVGGPDDEVFPPMKGVIQTQGKLDLPATAYLLSRSRAFLGVDSGPGHLAAAQGIPTLTLFGGMSYPQEWAPEGSRQRTLRASVPCSPCERRVCPGKGLICMTSLPPNRIWPEIQMFLSEKALIE